MGGNNIDSPDKLRHVTLPWQPNMECSGGTNPVICAGVRGKKGVCLGDSRAGHLKWIVVLILQVIVVMFETTGGLVRGHLVKNSCLTKLSKLLFFRGRFRHENSLESKK